MKGFIARTTAAASFACGVLTLTGCYGYRDLVDPCYPWRYNYQAQQEVCEPFATQVNNGHVLDQTIFTSHFERGKAVLTRGGQDKLQQLVRRRPQPDPVIYLATATIGSSLQIDDIVWRQDADPAVFVTERGTLDNERKEAIRKYLAAIRSDLSFQVLVHDPAQPSIPAAGALRSASGYTNGFTGSSGGGGGGGGAAPAAGGGG